MENIESCLFPFPESPSKPSTDSTFSTQILLTTSAKLLEICTEQDFEFRCLLQTTWALVLRSYLDTESILFGYSPYSRNLHLNGDRPETSHLDYAACMMQIDPSQSPTQLCQILAGLPDHEAISPAFKLLPLDAANVQLEALPFNTLVTFNNSSADSAAISTGLDRLHKEFVKNGLSIDFKIYEGTIHLDVMSHMLPQVQVKRIALTIEETLFAISESPTKPIEEILVLSEQDLNTLWIWNKFLPDPATTTAHAIIENQATATPDGEAVRSWDGVLTYGQLDKFASKLASHLLNKAPSQTQIVPVCFEKSKWTIVAMLAVLKAGFAFATMDPSQPTNRLEAMMEEVDAKVMIVSAAQIGRFAAPALLKITGINEICESPELLTTPQLPVVNPTDLAYTLFTSGSSGNPKAVLHSHIAACSNMIAKDKSKDTGYGPGNRVLQFASQAFGASVWEVLKTLAQGGCICIPSDQQRLNNLVKFISDEQITRTFLVPTFLKLLKPEDVPSLRILTVGGEPVLPELINTWASKVRLIEAFGMTEGVAMQTEIDSNCERTKSGQHLNGAAWIVDPSNYHRLTPIGGIGELCVEGPSLSSGYMGDKEKTDAAFVTNPAWRKDGRPRRLFRTGDLAQYNPQGVIKILGRKDTRVKLRGQRLELGEVESNMRKHLPVEIIVAADLVTPSYSSDVILVGFLGKSQGVGSGSTDSITELSSLIPELLKKMSAELPSYMVPGVILALERVPLNSSAKLDRKSLKEMASNIPREELLAMHAIGKEKVSPNTPMERKIRYVWSRVLGFREEDISVEDSFYFTGGNSLSAIKLITVARKEGISLSNVDVFKNPTIREMSLTAKLIDSGTQTFVDVGKDEASNERLRIELGDSLDDFKEFGVEQIAEATDMQAWSVYSGLLQTRGWSDYMYFDFVGKVDFNLLRKSCKLVLQQFSILRTVHVVRNRRTFQLALKRYPFEFLEYDLPFNLTITEFSHRLFHIDMQRTAKLGDPLVRFALIKQNLTSHRLVMRLSHAQYDAASLTAIWEAFHAAYNGNEMTHSCSLSQIETLITPSTSMAQAFWKDTLAGSKMTQILPHGSLTHKYVLDKNLSTAIVLPNLQMYGISTATLVTAAWSKVLAEISGSNDIVFGSITSGRHSTAAETENIMAACWNVVPVRTRLVASSSILNFLQQVQSQQLEAIPHENLGFRHLIEQCTDWPRWTRFSSILNHVNLEIEESAFNISEDLSYTFGIFEPTNDKTDLWLLTVPKENKLEVELRFCSQLFSEKMAKKLMHYFCSVVEFFANNVEMTVAGLPPKTWTTQVHLLITNGMTRSSVDLPPDISGIPMETQRIVENAWSLVLGVKELSHYPRTFTTNTPFYEVWGDLIAAAALSKIFQEAGCRLTVEQIVDNPTMYQQMMLCTKLGNLPIENISPLPATLLTQPDRLRITIIGCGLAGAIAARVLRTHHTVIVLERSPTVVELGAAINIGPHNVKFLETIGFDRRKAGCCRLGFTATWSKAGVLLHEQVLSHRDDFGEDWLTHHRADLRNEFLRLAECPSSDLNTTGKPANVCFGAEAVGVDTETGTVMMNDGSVYESDLVIGADGINSIVRPIVLDGQSTAPPKPSGMSIFRFTIPAEDAIRAHPNLPRDREKGACLGMVLALDATKRSIVFYPCRDFEQFNFGALIPDQMLRSKIPNIGNMEGSVQEMLELFSDFPEWMMALMEIATNIQLWQIRHQDPLPTYVRGRVVLIGDAAHAMTPLQGQGANQAIEDAEGLLLLNEGDVSRDSVHGVLKQWERVRLPRASKVQKISLDAVDNMNGSNAYVYGKHYFMYPGIREGLRRLDEGQEVVPWAGK